MNRHRTNEQIRGVREVRLIDSAGKMIGIVLLQAAKDQAASENLDLVEMNRSSNPPVCKIMDFGKYKYELSKSMKEAKKNQHVVELKEMTLRPVTDTHDLLVKAKHVKEWLEDGCKVKITVRMKGRERAHPIQAIEIIKELLANVGQHKVEQPPREEGKLVSCTVSGI